jgi:primosomal protein N' (replication factor Y) (superfamily II helicase)
MYLDVLVELVNKHIDHTYTYIKNNQDVSVGCRVLVPFGKQKLEGFVMKIHDNKPDYSLKQIINVIDDEPVLNEEMLKLGYYLSLKTFSNLTNCYQAMLPTALKAKEKILIQEKYEYYYEIIDSTNIKSESQVKIINSIKENNNKKDQLVLISRSSLNTLIKNNKIKEIKKEVYREESFYKENDKQIILTKEQEEITEDIINNKNNYYPALLHGVTGSGKTEVYIKIIKDIINDKKEVILLVPEISLTPQMISIFKSRFKGEIAILHSGLSSGEKFDEWRKILRKEVKIVIGARSAIFAPFTNLGLIIIDEEHSQTYKQENNPKYHALDVALFRAKTYNIPVLLGSATPSIETYTRALIKEFKLLTLDKRVNNSMPLVKVVDMKEEIKKRNKIISEELKDKINDRLSKNEQVIILLNRRGYTTVITCHKCGYKETCPNCDIPLTFHKNNNINRCHYCGYTKRKIEICPECKSLDINEYGMGTQKLEEYINDNFKARVIRMDKDTTTKKNSHHDIVNAFKNHEYDILIGTQMISKGLDFDDVTLVGVLNADASLNIPDFRSAERTYQLLSQVAGRSGRREKQGEVIIQSFNVDHYSINYAINHDYLSFYNKELDIRKKLNYPPYYNLCLIKISSKDYDLLIKEADKIKTYFNKEIKNNILGPSFATNPKINNIYYMQIIIKYKKIEEIKESIVFVNNMYKENNKINVDIDINPLRI